MPRPRRRPPRPGALTELQPLKIMTQIALLQLIYYATATTLILFTALVAGKKFSFNLVLNWQSLRGDTTVGWMLGLVWLLVAGVGAIPLLLLISRSKLIPDFALTLHFIHLVLVSLYSHSIPTNWLWWALQLASAGLMTSLGVWSCRWRELRPITFGGNSGAGAGRTDGSSTVSGGSTERTGTSEGNTAGEEHHEGGDVEQGYGRRGRGRGREGGETYEMVPLKSDTEATSTAP